MKKWKTRGTISDEVIAELKSIPIHDICDVLNINHIGDCPTGHDSENHKCFHTWTGTNTWNCFHCRDNGRKIQIDTIGLVIAKLNYEFVDACKFLAEQFRPELTDKINNISPEDIEKIKVKRDKEAQVFKALNYAMGYYEKKLSETPEALKYITSRGVTEDFIKNNPYVKFGHAPLNQDDLGKEMINLFGEEITCLTGLFKKSEKGWVYPTIKKWIAELKEEIPVNVYSYEKGGQTKYLIGRRIIPELPGEIPGKKGANRFKKLDVIDNTIIKNEIFGIDSLGIKNPNFKNSILIAEGLFDAILAIQNNIPTISPITISFSQHQIDDMVKVAKRFDTIYIVPDPDKPGETGATKTARILIEAGKTVKVVTLPKVESVENLDLADYFQRYSVEDFLTLCNSASSLIDFILNTIPENTSKSDLGKKFTEKNLINLINATDAFEKEEYIKKISQRFETGIDSVKSFFLNKQIKPEKETLNTVIPPIENIPLPTDTDDPYSGIDIKTPTETRPLPPVGTEKKQINIKKPPLKPISLKDFKNTKYKPIKFLVEDILPEGLSILAGKPKTGKTFLALNMAISIASGIKTMGHLQTEKTGVAYISIDEYDRSMHEKIQNIEDFNGNNSTLENFDFIFDVSKLSEGGYEQINEYLDSKPDIKFLVIDTLGRVRKPTRRGNAYEVDVESIGLIQDICKNKGVSILLLHHLKKGMSDDYVENLSGSMGISATVDTIMVIERDRGENEARLKVTGRKIKESKDLAMKFNKEFCSWEIEGDAKEVRMSKERKEIIEILKDGQPHKLKEIAERLEKKPDSIKQLCHKLTQEKFIYFMYPYGYVLKQNYFHDHQDNFDICDHHDHHDHQNDNMITGDLSDLNDNNIDHQWEAIQDKEMIYPSDPVIVGTTQEEKSEENKKIFTQKDVIRESKQRYNATLKLYNNSVNPQTKKDIEQNEKYKSAMEGELKALKSVGIEPTEEELKTGFIISSFCGNCINFPADTPLNENLKCVPTGIIRTGESKSCRFFEARAGGVLI